MCKICKTGYDGQEMHPVVHCERCGKCHFAKLEYCTQCGQCHSGKCGPLDFCSFCGEELDQATENIVYLQCGHCYHKYCFVAGKFKCCFCGDQDWDINLTLAQ